MGRDRSKAAEETITKDRPEIDEPRMFQVLLLNDDYTSMEFVVSILESVFMRSPAEAQAITLSVHQTGSGVAGVYTRDLAETKVAIVQSLARQQEFPLRCAIQPV